MKKPILALLIALLGLTWSGVVSGAGRDADGSRMQAREQKLGSSVQDRLSPPSDTVDWRYVRVTGSHDLEIRLSGKPADKSLRIQVTNAVGKPIMEGATQKGQLVLSRKVDPGLYYVAVSANGLAEYTITIK